MRLYPRMSGGNHRLEKYAKAAAHRLLDKAKSGKRVPEHRITWALRVTGDLIDIKSTIEKTN